MSTSSRRHPPSPTYDIIEDVEGAYKYRPGGFHPTSIGDTLKDGRYRIVHKLGYGGYSTIWLALDTKIRQYVAVKICSAGTGGKMGEDALLQHLSSTRQDGHVRHLGTHLVPTLLDTFTHRGPNGQHSCLVMTPAWMSARDAKDASVRGLFRPDVARSIVAQLALAVDFAHGKGVVHGDIHIGNVFFRLPPCINNLTPEEIYRKYGEPTLERVTRIEGKPLDDSVPSHLVVPLWMGKSSEDMDLSEAAVILSDFGESYMPASVQCFHSNAPQSFLPPEARLPSEPLGFAADIWSLACLIWEILGGRPLFESWVATDDEVLADEVDLLGETPP